MGSDMSTEADNNHLSSNTPTYRLSTNPGNNHSDADKVIATIEEFIEKHDIWECKKDRLDKLCRICEKLYYRLVDYDFYKNDNIIEERNGLFERLDKELGELMYELGYSKDLYCGVFEGEF